jgi:hypothetical protein
VGKSPLNFVSVVLDFRRGSVIDLSNPSGTPTANDSQIVVAGQNPTWAQGVHQRLRDFFKEYQTGQGWLHGPHIYDLLLFLLGLPLSLTMVYRINRWFRGAAIGASWPDALFITFYVYIVLASLLLFRIVFGYAQ